MEGVNGKMFTTNQYAIIAFGKAEKSWPFIACSNAKFTTVFKLLQDVPCSTDSFLGGVPALYEGYGRRGPALTHQTEFDLKEW